MLKSHQKISNFASLKYSYSPLTCKKAISLNPINLFQVFQLTLFPFIHRVIQMAVIMIHETTAAREHPQQLIIYCVFEQKLQPTKRA